MVEYPRPSEEELPELYEELDRMMETAAEVIRDQFTVEIRDGADVVVFRDAATEDYLDALWADSDGMVPFFQKITGLSDREFERQYGIADVGSRLRGRKTDFRDETRAVAFADALGDLLPAELYLETLLFAFIKLWETDQRRHYRARYEKKVREFLSERGVPVFKGTTLPGEPDLVIPETEPYEVVGEVRVIQQKDRKKRFKEFGSEARAAKEHFPEVKFVVVANVGRLVETEDRESVRADIHESSAADIDVVVFQDELDELVDELERWDIRSENDDRTG